MTSSKTSGKIERRNARLIVAHEMFFSAKSGMNAALNSRSYSGLQLDRAEYEKYGYVIGKDKEGEIKNNLLWYGNCQVRFKKDKVAGRTSWTSGDLLNDQGFSRPSRVTNPSAATFDDMLKLNAQGEKGPF